MTNSKYKLLLLDYGGVYSFDYEFRDFEKTITALFGTSIPTTKKVAFARIDDEFGSNILTTQEYIHKVAELLESPKRPTSEELEKVLLSSTFTPSPEMVDLIFYARRRGLKVGLLSDICTFEIKYVESFGGYNHFDKVLLSAVAGMTKQNLDFYKLALIEFDVKPNEVFFIDDREEFVKAANSLGFSTLLADKSNFSTAELLSSEIKKHLYL